MNFIKINFFQSHAGPINCRSNGNTINRDNTLQQRSYQTSRFHGCNGSLPCNCNPEYRSHPYMSIVPNSQYILEETSGRLSVQVRKFTKYIH